MGQFKERIRHLRAKRPIIGGNLLMISGIITLLLTFRLASDVELLSFTSSLIFEEMFVGVAMVAAGVVVFLRPALSMMVGVGTVLYVGLAILFPYSFFSTSLPGTIWTPVAVLGGLLCIVWTKTETGKKSLKDQPTT